jgi:hypothetical protein
MLGNKSETFLVMEGSRLLEITLSRDRLGVGNEIRKIILKCTFEKLSMRMWTGLKWAKIESSRLSDKREISGSRGGEYEVDSFLGYYAV